MQSLKCSLSLVVALGLCHMCLAMPGRFIRAAEDENLLTLQFEDIDRELNPINAEALSSDELERNKRKLPDATFEAKNAVLGFVFGTPAVTPNSAANSTLKIYPDDTVIFDRKSVSLELPDRLFSSAFQTATSASKLFGNLIRNSSRRFSYFSELFKPLFGDALVIKDSSQQVLTCTTSATINSEISDDIDNFVVATMEPETTVAQDDVVATTIDSLNDGSNDV